MTELYHATWLFQTVWGAHVDNWVGQKYSGRGRLLAICERANADPGTV